MANTKSYQKVLKYLREKGEAVTPSNICLNVHLKWQTIQDCLEILKQTNQIEFLTSGSTSLVKIKSGENNGNTKQ